MDKSIRRQKTNKQTKGGLSVPEHECVTSVYNKHEGSNRRKAAADI